MMPKSLSPPAIDDPPIEEPPEIEDPPLMDEPPVIDDPPVIAEPSTIEEPLRIVDSPPIEESPLAGCGIWPPAGGWPVTNSRQASSCSGVRLLSRVISCFSSRCVPATLTLHGQPAVFLVGKADLDRRLGRQVGGQVADHALADLRAIVGRGAFAFDDLHQDRFLAGLLRAKHALGRDRQRRVARNQDRVALAARCARRWPPRPGCAS